MLPVGSYSSPHPSAHIQRPERHGNESCCVMLQVRSEGAARAPKTGGNSGSSLKVERRVSVRRRYLTIVVAVSLVLIAMIATAASAAAFPADTTKTGQACTACHTSASGGALTATGQAYQASGRQWPIPAAKPAAPAPAAPAPAAPAPAAPAPAAPAAPAQAAPAAPAAPAPVAAPVAGKAPASLPAAGDAGSAALFVPMAITMLGLAASGAGLRLRRRD